MKSLLTRNSKPKKSVLLAILIAVTSIVAFTGCTKDADSEKMNDLIFRTYNKLLSSDGGITGGTSKIALDLKGMDDMSDDAKEKLRVLFGEETDKEIMFSNYEELKEKGELSDNGHYWKEGVIYTFELIESKGDEIKFSCTIWRSGLGAVGAGDCKAKWNEKTESWDITFGRQFIS